MNVSHLVKQINLSDIIITESNYLGSSPKNTISICIYQANAVNTQL